MGCGSSISSINHVNFPNANPNDSTFLYNNYKKTQNICKNQSTQIWQCQQNGTKTKYLIKIFKNIYINTKETEEMYKNFQQQIERLKKIAEGKGIKQKQKNYNNQILLAESLEKNNKNHQKPINISQSLVHYVKVNKDQNNNLVLIMKYIQNKSLGDYVKGKLPGIFKQAQIARYTQQILRTVKWLRYKANLICCNIKPNNIFFQNISKQNNKNKSNKGSKQQEKNIMIGDYYNLEQYFTLEEPSYKKDPIYAAPENINQKQYFKQTDIWRVGCFVLEMMTCIKPWYLETTDLKKVLNNIKNQMHPPINAKLSANCKDFLQKCFDPDHNRRKSIEELLKHPWIVQSQKDNLKVDINQNKENSKNINPTKLSSKNTESNIKYSRQTTSQEQIGSYKIQVQNLEQIEEKIRQLNKLNQKDRKYTYHLVKPNDGHTLATTIMRKRTLSRNRSPTHIQQNVNILANNKSNKGKNTDNYPKKSTYEDNQVYKIESQERSISMKLLKSPNSRLKTENNIIPSNLQQYKDSKSKKKLKTQVQNHYDNYKNDPYSYNLASQPYMKSRNNQRQQILNLLNQQNYQCNIQNSPKNPSSHNLGNSNSNFKIKTIPSKKIISTTGLKNSSSNQKLLNTSKVNQNQITLNNQIIQQPIYGEKYKNFDIQTYNNTKKSTASFDYEETQRNLSQVIREIQAEGGQKYYKKPLKLLKKKLRHKQNQHQIKDKFTLRTQTSITLQESRMNRDQYQPYSYDPQIQHINFDSSQHYLSNDSINLLTQSKISSHLEHQYQPIQTAVSKAQKNRYLTEQKILKQQRQNEKLKWQKELKQGQQFIKKQMKQKYYKHFSKGNMKFYTQAVME